MPSISFPLHTISVPSVSATTTSSGTSAPASIGALLPEPKTGDVGLAVAQMALEDAYASRTFAREDKKLADEAMRAAEEQQLDAMKEEADEKYAAAKWEAWGKIGEGVLGIAGGIATAKNKPAVGESLTAGGKVVSGTLSLFAAGHKQDADRAGIAAKRAENEVAADKRARDNAEDAIKEARDHIRTALDFLRELRSTESKSMSSAIRA